MEKLMDILHVVNQNVDYQQEKSLIEDRVLDSIQIVYLISLISEEYDIEIEPQDLTPENFNSVEAIIRLIRRYKKDG